MFEEQYGHETISKDSTHAISLFKEFVLYMIEDASHQ